MKNEVFISIIVVTHKRPKLLARCLQSILQQNVSNEIILCSDEGTVETKTIASMYLRETDSFVVVPDRKGPAATRNIGVGLARGKWICFLDDDDSFEQNYFANALDILIKNKNIINYFNFNSIIEDEELNIIQNERVNLERRDIINLWICNFIPNNALMIPNEIAKQISIDEKLQSHEDWDYILALLSRYDFKHHSLYSANVHRSSDKSRNTNAIANKSYLLDFITIYRKWNQVSAEVKKERCIFLAKSGFNIPQEML